MARNILICDDEPEMRFQLEQYLRRIAYETNDTFNIHSFSSGETLLKDFPKTAQVLLLDIKMGSMDGIEVARRLRSRNISVYIFFITNMVQYALDGYDVHAYCFLPKPILYETLKRQLKEAFYQIDAANGFLFALQTPKGTQVFNTDKILYIEVINHTVLIHTDSAREEYTISLSKLEEKLADYHFFKCHKSFLVNLRKVASINQNDLRLVNGEVIPLSKYRRKEFIMAFTEYIGGSAYYD